MSGKITENKDNSKGGSVNTKSPLGYSESKMQEIARIAARKKAMEGAFEVMPHGSKIYFIAKGWESSMIEGDPKVKCVMTLKDFRDAFCSVDIKTIFIPQSFSKSNPEGSIVTMSQIQKVCSQHANNKVIYMEVDKENNDGQQ